MITRKGIIILTSFSIVFAILELGMNWDPSTNPSSPLWMSHIFTPLVSLYFYRIIYTLIFVFPSYLASGKLISLETLWYLIYGSTIEDIAYWVIGLEVPYSWAWFYPVYYDIPLDDVIGFIALAILYKIIKIREITKS